MSDASAMYEAIEAGDTAKFRELLEAHPEWLDLEDAGGGVLFRALDRGRPEIARAVVEARDEPAVFGEALAGNRDRVQEILDARPELRDTVGRDGFGLVHLAAFFGQDRVLDTLLEQGVDPEQPTEHPSRMLPIHCAVLSGRMEGIDMLLNRGADPDARRADGRTALMLAAAHGYERPIMTIVHHNCDADLEGDDGKTARALALENGHDAVAALIPH